MERAETRPVAAAVVEQAPRLAPVERHKGPGKLKHAPPAPRHEALQAAEGLRGEIVELLKKRRMTSKEIIDATRKTAGVVYTQLSRMRQEGTVATQEDESDGRRKNFLLA
jgi:predicted Rossmann fold nucleotide-binding protein DprA/Smf involved in DNA uptake